MKNTKYDKLSDKEKHKAIKKLYIEDKLSFANIANKLGTYANKIRRDANKFNIKTRDRSQAQKNALETGSIKHPTKGKARTDEEKQKIGLSQHENWENQSKAERASRSKKAKLRWNAMSATEKQNLLTSAHQAIRETSKTGSKLEKFLLTKLIKNGYKPEFHKEQILSNTKLHIDLFLAELNTAIEVDGPSHYVSVWGEESLARNQKYDEKKNGLIIGKGMRLIRIKQLNDYSNARAEIVFSKLNNILKQIKQNLLDSSQKILYIED